LELKEFDQEKLKEKEEYADTFKLIDECDDENEEGELVALPPPIKKRAPKARCAKSNTSSIVES
jgi:hypothetical protein